MIGQQGGGDVVTGLPRLEEVYIGSDAEVCARRLPRVTCVDHNFDFTEPSSCEPIPRWMIEMGNMTSERSKSSNACLYPHCNQLRTLFDYHNLAHDDTWDVTDLAQYFAYLAKASGKPEFAEQLGAIDQTDFECFLKNVLGIDADRTLNFFFEHFYISNAYIIIYFCVSISIFV